MIDPTTLNPTVVANPDLLTQIMQLNGSIAQLVQFTSHVSTGAMTAHIIEWAKGKQGFARFWSLLSDKGKVVIGLIAAALPAAGITVAFQPAANHTWTLTATGLSLAALGKLGWSLAQNWVFQQGWYQSVIKPKPVAGVQPTAAAPQPQPVIVQESK